MKIIERALRGASTLVFLDLEATQLSHEAIEIGAEMCEVDPQGNPRKSHPPFRVYVKAKHPIGRLVRTLTGIDERLLKEEGTSFQRALDALKHYIGYRLDETLFLTWGPSDIQILEATRKQSEADDSFLRFLYRRHLDFQAFLKTYVQDGNGNPLSLHNAILAFSVPFKGREHDATSDAMSLFRLYQAVISSPDVLEREYMKTLSHYRKLPLPLLRVLEAIQEGKTVDRPMWELFVRECFK